MKIEYTQNGKKKEIKVQTSGFNGNSPDIWLKTLATVHISQSLFGQYRKSNFKKRLKFEDYMVQTGSAKKGKIYISDLIYNF